MSHCEIDTQNWSSFCEDAAKDHVDNYSRRGIWWGKRHGESGLQQPSLWDVTSRSSFTHLCY